MVKAYTSKDISFTGDNTFSDDVDANDARVAGLNTSPSAVGDGANINYVNNIDNGVVDFGRDYYSGHESSYTDLCEVTVTVPTGGQVLLLATGYIAVDYDDGEEGAIIFFKRGSTGLGTKNLLLVQSGEGDSIKYPFTTHYLDTSPGTGSVTYKLNGFAEEYIRTSFYVFVFK